MGDLTCKMQTADDRDRHTQPLVTLYSPSRDMVGEFRMGFTGNNKNTVLEVDKIHIKPAYQGKNMSAWLLLLIVEKVKDMGFENLTIKCNAQRIDGRPPHAYYAQKLGFRVSNNDENEMYLYSGLGIVDTDPQRVDDFLQCGELTRTWGSWGTCNCQQDHTEQMNELISQYQSNTFPGPNEDATAWPPTAMELNASGLRQRLSKLRDPQSPSRRISTARVLDDGRKLIFTSGTPWPVKTGLSVAIAA